MKLLRTAVLCIVPFLMACQSDDDQLCPEAPGPEAKICLVSGQSALIADVAAIPASNASLVSTLFEASSQIEITAVAISPQAEWAAVATVDLSPAEAEEWVGELRIINLLYPDSLLLLDKPGLTQALSFPNAQAAMHIMALGWESDSVLIVHVRPRTDFLPIAAANVSMRYEVTSGQTLTLSPSGSTEDFAIAFPDLPEKTLYSHSLEVDQIVISGQALANLPPVSMYDVSFRLGD